MLELCRQYRMSELLDPEFREKNKGTSEYENIIRQYNNLIEFMLEPLNFYWHGYEAMTD